jgi:hypothetical protein
MAPRYQAPARTVAPSIPLVQPNPVPRPGNVMPNFPAPLPPAPKPGIIIAPTPNNGFIGLGVTPGGHGAVIQHQDHVGGYQTNSGMYVAPSGANAGVSITTDPNGRAIGGAATFGITTK